jgi:hypothetical protein
MKLKFNKDEIIKIFRDNRFLKEKIKPFVENNINTINIIAIKLLISFIFSLMTIWLLRDLLNQVNSLQIYNLLLYYSLIIICFYILLSKNQKKIINDHQAFFAVIGLLIPVVLFFSQLTNEQVDQFYKIEAILKEENNRNYPHLQSIVTDLSRDPNTTFWENFSTDSYKNYWYYINFNKSQDCKNLYADLTVGLDIINNVNKMRQQLILTPNNLYKTMLSQASSTLPVLSLIVSKCQSI